MAGPLTGYRVIEMAGLGPAPFAAMMLADMGADVIRVERAGAPDLGLDLPSRFNVMNRGKRSIALNLKQEADHVTLLDLIDTADALIEGYRPGVMERLGLGPDVLQARRPSLVFGRVTGWGQAGPLAETAGHDINYLALTGILAAIGPKEKPYPPLNLLADFAGGGMYLAFGITCALLEAQRSGSGQVVDAAMIDGAASLAAPIFGFLQAGLWSEGRAQNFLDSGVPWYDTYETGDGQWIAVGAIEPRFYTIFLERLGLTDDAYQDRSESNWPRLRAAFAQAFKARTRAEWCDTFYEGDACVSPVLSFSEAPAHPQMMARGTFVTVDGVLQPAPAPRFSRTPAVIRSAPPHPGQHTAELPSMTKPNVFKTGT